ncbi:hypothetical protein [Chryseobacterium candidae]|uniref:Barstar (barnase inhibitor) domain-containing protein n=1 Tax=Chryseobacterium candidae TaxID=1978493 RepID=A0ABY2R6T1_9FLAO|nr:hypothetical protein [Chryseobacterium candidae]THV59060.1 hypothetical protein EK417_11915 [Chryseobacterium candidae]
MEVFLNNIKIDYLDLTRNKKIVNDELLLKVKPEAKSIILAELEKPEIKLTVKIYNKAGKKEILYKTRFIVDYVLTEEDYNETDGIVLYGTMINKMSSTGRGYDQYLMENFYNWFNYSEFNWWETENSELKNSYLQACFIWNHGLYKMSKENSIMKMEGSLVKNNEDYFCYLGELFFGKRGFMGNGLDSLHDHTIDVSKNNNMQKFYLHINSAAVLEKALGTGCFFRSLEILKRTGLNIYVDDLAF